jgi:serine/threonine protein kinase
MGVVYRATDTRLNREVAIKVLPAAFVADTERLARFQREAQLLAALNHPNIGGIHGLEEAGAERFLVLELIEGEDLADRLKRGAIPVAEALPLALQLTQALEAAHARGIVHRDLKPANIKITPDGKVKVLDFGLAKALALDAGDSDPAADLSLSPTMTAAMGTQAGMILGTAAYMSPEQARGKPVDRRADIWAFGVVLFEMLTGDRLYAGETATDIIASVVTRDPDWDRLPVKTPAGVRRMLRRCLQKDPRQRLRDVGDARLDLSEEFDEDEVAGAAPSPPASSRRTGLGVLLGVIAGAAMAALAFTLLAPQEMAHSTWSGIPSPKGTTFSFKDLLEISPNGEHVAFVAAAPDDSATMLLWIRDLDSEQARPLNGTAGAYLPFWSPDSTFVGYFSGRKLRKIHIDGGISTVLADSGKAPRGAVWGKDGTILFAGLTFCRMETISSITS